MKAMVSSVRDKGVTQPAIVCHMRTVAMRLCRTTAARKPASLRALRTCPYRPWGTVNNIGQLLLCHAAGFTGPLDGKPYITEIKSSFISFYLHNIT